MRYVKKTKTKSVSLQRRPYKVVLYEVYTKLTRETKRGTLLYCIDY